VQLAFEQLRRAAQSAERILDLVRELPNHQAAAVETRHEVVVARDAMALRVIRQFEQQMRSGDLAFERGDRDIENARRLGCADRTQRQLAIRDAFAGLQHAPQIAEQAVRIVQEVAERPAARLVQAECEEVLRRDVRVDRAQLGIEHDDAGRQRVEQIRGIEMRQRGGKELSDHR
jgi:hypothetical protein